MRQFIVICLFMFFFFPLFTSYISPLSKLCSSLLSFFAKLSLLTANSVQPRDWSFIQQLPPVAVPPPLKPEHEQRFNFQLTPVHAVHIPPLHEKAITFLMSTSLFGLTLLGA
jgi:hypothetical protein